MGRNSPADTRTAYRGFSKYCPQRGKWPTAWQGCACHTPSGRAGQRLRPARKQPPMCLPSESWSGSGATQGLWVGAALIRTATLRLTFSSRSVMSDSLQPHGLQQARLPCLSPTPGDCSNSCPLNFKHIQICLMNMKIYFHMFLYMRFGRKKSCLKIFLFSNLFIWLLRVLVTVCGVFSLHCGMWVLLIVAHGIFNWGMQTLRCNMLNLIP